MWDNGVPLGLNIDLTDVVKLLVTLFHISNLIQPASYYHLCTCIEATRIVRNKKMTRQIHRERNLFRSVSIELELLNSSDIEVRKRLEKWRQLFIRLNYFSKR